MEQTIKFDNEMKVFICSELFKTRYKHLEL